MICGRVLDTFDECLKKKKWQILDRKKVLLGTFPSCCAPGKWCYITIIFCCTMWLRSVLTSPMEIVVFNPHDFDLHSAPLPTEAAVPQQQQLLGSWEDKVVYWQQTFTEAKYVPCQLHWKSLYIYWFINFISQLTITTAHRQTESWLINVDTVHRVKTYRYIREDV